MPGYLIIHLKRFEEVDQKYSKNSKSVEYPLSIDMDEYCNSPWERLGKFKLMGLILHKSQHGNGMEGGHYQAFSRRLDG